MKLVMRRHIVLAVIILAMGLFALAQPAAAASDCTRAKGNLLVADNGNGTTSGTITQGGKLNGTTHAVFTSGLTATPDANTFSYTDDFTVTTNKGVLKTHNIGIFDVGLGLFSEIARIDPNASTGAFAGATGVLYINGTTTDGGATFQAEITGEICAN
ncbi:MAG: hypothetical protein HGA45_23425 [Chloroflexales bacterium]|nr:hypothetical protein [Chloroflexales bacterium]